MTDLKNLTVRVSSSWMPWIISGVLLVLLVFTRECGRPEPCPEPVVTVDTLIKVDTVIDSFKVEVPVKPELDTVYDSVPVFIPDPTTIVEDYFRVRKYKIPIRKDSVGDLTLYATVFMNQMLDDAHLGGEIFQKTRIENHYFIVKEPTRGKMFVGGMISGTLGTSADNQPMINNPGLAVMGMYQTKQDHVYQGGYDPFNKIAHVGLYYKISFRKKGK